MLCSVVVVLFVHGECGLWHQLHVSAISLADVDYLLLYVLTLRSWLAGPHMFRSKVVSKITYVLLILVFMCQLLYVQFSRCKSSFPFVNLEIFSHDKLRVHMGILDLSALSPCNYQVVNVRIVLMLLNMHVRQVCSHLSKAPGARGENSRK